MVYILRDTGSFGFRTYVCYVVVRNGSWIYRRICLVVIWKALRTFSISTTFSNIQLTFDITRRRNFLLEFLTRGICLSLTNKFVMLKLKAISINYHSWTFPDGIVFVSRFGLWNLYKNGVILFRADSNFNQRIMSNSHFDYNPVFVLFENTFALNISLYFAC